MPTPVFFICVICFVWEACIAAAAPGIVEQITGWVGDSVDRIEFRMRNGSVLAYGHVGRIYSQSSRHLNSAEYLKSIEQVYSEGCLGDTLIFRTSVGNLIPFSGSREPKKPVTKVFEAADGKQIVGLDFERGLLVGIQTVDLDYHVHCYITLAGFKRSVVNNEYIMHEGPNSVINGAATFLATSGEGMIHFCDNVWIVRSRFVGKISTDVKDCSDSAVANFKGNIFDMSESSKAWSEKKHDGEWSVTYSAGVKRIAFSPESVGSMQFLKWFGLLMLMILLSCCSFYCCRSNSPSMTSELIPARTMTAATLTPDRSTRNQVAPYCGVSMSMIHGGSNYALPNVAALQHHASAHNFVASSGSESDGWILLGGCFVKSTMLKLPDGTMKMVSAFREGDEVVSAQNASLLRVDFAQRWPQSVRELVTIQTADSHVTVTSDHRIALAGGLVKQAKDIQSKDVVICGSREQVVMKVRSFRMNAECVELRFDVDLPVETFVVPSRGIWTYGDYMPPLPDELRTEDGF